MESVMRLSQIEEDVAVIMAVWQSPMKLQVYSYTVKGRPVSLLPNHRRHINGNEYQLCVFPDYSQQWVNVGNLRGFKLNKFAGGNN